jgi:hypothetical protein
MSQLPSTTRRFGVDVTARDVEIMRGLFESRVMGLSHLTALYFEGRQEAAKKRVQKLKSAGFIAERGRERYELSVLFITRRGIDHLAEAGHLADYPRLGAMKLEKRMRVSPLTLRHELDCMDVKTALTVAVNSRPGFEVTVFQTWPRLFQFPAYNSAGARVPVRPDGFIRVTEEGADYCYFLEVDRSTESQEVLADRGHCYVNYYRQGGFAVRNGGRKEEYQDFPFRVLMIFRNAERRNNAAERLLNNRPPILTQVILTTIEEILKDPLGLIFMQPVDYRNAVRGTPFESGLLSETAVYRRRPEREKLIDERVQKVSIIF